MPEPAGPEMTTRRCFCTSTPKAARICSASSRSRHTTAIACTTPEQFSLTTPRSTKRISSRVGGPAASDTLGLLDALDALDAALDALDALDELDELDALAALDALL